MDLIGSMSEVPCTLTSMNTVTPEAAAQNTLRVQDEDLYLTTAFLGELSDTLRRGGSRPWTVQDRQYDAASDTWTLTLTGHDGVLGALQVLAVKDRDGIRGIGAGTVTQAPGPCVACGTRRERTAYLFLDRAAGDGEATPFWLGRTCAPAYLRTNHMSTVATKFIGEALVALLEDPAEVAARAAARGVTRPRYSTLKILAAALASRREHPGMGGAMLAEHVSYLMQCHPEDLPAPITDQLLSAAIVQDWATTELVAPNDFTAAAVRAAARTTNRPNSIRTLVSLPALYAEQVRREDAAAAGRHLPGEGYVDEFAAPVGQRVVFATAEVEQVRLLPSESHLVVFRSAEGHRLTWFATATPQFAVGDIVQVTGTVRAHKVFRGVHDTQLTRCRVTF
jgi:hypothetical protein